MSHRFHTIVGALMGSTGIVYGITNVMETRRHQVVLVNPGFIGLPHAARHALVTVIPGRIGSSEAGRHGLVMASPATIASNNLARHGLVLTSPATIAESSLARHTLVHDAFATTDWSWVSNGGGNKMTAAIEMLRPGEVYDDIEYSIDGAAWVSTGQTSGSAIFNIADVIGSGLRLRALIGSLPTPPSEEKLLSPLVLLQVGGVSNVMTFDMPAFTFDVAKNYIVFVAATRTTTAPITLTGNIGAVGRAPGAGTTLTSLGLANSPDSTAPTQAFLVTGQTGVLTFRTTSNQTSTSFVVSMFEMLPGWTGVASSAGVGINSGLSAITISGFTPTLTPRPVVNHTAPRESIRVPEYIATTGKLIQGPPFSFSGLDNNLDNMFPVTRVQRMTGAGNITSNLNVAGRRSLLALELL